MYTHKVLPAFGTVDVLQYTLSPDKASQHQAVCISKKEVAWCMCHSILLVKNVALTKEIGIQFLFIDGDYY